MSDLERIRNLARDVDVTAICDADKTTRVVHGIRPRSHNRWACGPAYTVRCRDDFFGVVEAIESANPGDVVVVDGGGREIAYAGELFARAAQTRGLAAIVVDGGYRDMTYVSTCNLPVYSRHVTPMAGGTNKLGELQVPITCGGVTVSPGDIFIADTEGIVVLAPGRAMEVLRAARDIKTAEAAAIAKIEQGKSLVHCLNVTAHRENLASGKPSRLAFTD
ncbi:RraA family protein [Pendulispora brunnea]|uniref:Putative 4-hydroxy-4-methyl-2-oxoglutarate aldolase n=1 Tax=Pendulispora brunnea TaxID=2905690 RepID=A0ABZ2JY75_9BACT